MRELLQNAADASASKVVIKFETIPSAKVPLPQDPNPTALIKHTLQHHRLKRLVVTNNGQPFSGNDWSRLKRIAEGNPDETKIGAFGVGFYSVFAECEEPLVRSGNEAMAFYWKGNSLFTRTSKLQNQDNTDTSFILDYRNDTTAVPSLLPLCQFLSTSLTFVGISDVELFIDDWRILQLRKTTSPSKIIQVPKFMGTRTKDGLLKIDSVAHETSQLDAIWLRVIGWNPKIIQSTSMATASKSSKGFHGFWNSITSTSRTAAAEKVARAEKEAELELAKDVLGEAKTTAFLSILTAQLISNVDKSFARELERATKKPPPRSTRIALLTAFHDQLELSNPLDNAIARATDVFANVLPRKSGRIFIGFPTHQTTGIGAHISAPSVIPTVERESIDLNARWVRTWNEEMLRAAGMVSRIAWCEQSDALKMRLDDLVKGSGSGKMLLEQMNMVLPQSLQNLNQYEFSETTPSSKVGNFIEEGFWDCDKSGSLEMDILSTRGVVSSKDVRLGTEELSFLEGISFLPKEIANKPPDIIKKLIDNGVITQVVLTDIKRELERQSLSSQHLIEFLQWLAKKVTSKEMDTQGASSLLKVTVANDNENNRVIQLGLIRNYQIPQKIPIDLPVPEDTIPHKFTKSIDGGALSGFGWEELQIVPWVKFLVSDTRIQGTSKRLDLDKDFAALVLPAISKQWKGLSDSSKQTMKNLLSDKTVIPTKLGMRKPSDAYFTSVKLFDDLATITLSNLSDHFLLKLGVRKTVQLELVFERLLSPQKTDGLASTWSHVDLIKYLVSVRADVPPSDIKKLQKTAICTAEGERDGQRYRLSGLFEPKDELRPLQARFVYWPGIYRPHAEESKFMRILGLRTHPSVLELIELIGSPNKDPVLRDNALHYLVNFQHQHAYPVSEIAGTKIPFLPLENDDKARSTPLTCYTNPKAALFGCKILRQDLHQHASKLGVERDPPMGSCVEWLVKNPPATIRSARELFEYFASRLNELGTSAAGILGKANIVPIMSQETSREKQQISLLRRQPPKLCFLGSGGNYADILDYIDFGEPANSFLIRCGAKPEPTSLELAQLVVFEPARIWDTLNNKERYLGLLIRIAQDWSSIKKEKDLVRQMKESAFLLASTEPISNPSGQNVNQADDCSDDEDQGSHKLWQLTRASKIVVLDDATNYNHFKSDVLAAPEEDVLEKLYLALGASNISSVVIQTNRLGRRLHDPESAQKMKKLVVERIKLSLSNLLKDQIRHDSGWIEKNLNFVPVSGISLIKTLRGQQTKHTLSTNALYEKLQDSLLKPVEHVVYFKPDVKDLFDISLALCTVCLYKTCPQQATVLTFLLTSNLRQVQARGYNVSRILKRQAEDKIHEEEKRNQLHEEQARLASVISLNKSPEIPVRHDKNESQGSTMPGVFPDTPERPGVDRALDLLRETNHGHHPLLTTFKERMRDIWRGGSDSDITTLSEGSLSPSDDSSHNADNNNGVARRTERQGAKTMSITDTATLQAQLERTIKASKPYNSGTLESTGLENLVKETPSFCDRFPAESIILQGQTSHGMKVFCAKATIEPTRFLSSNGSGLEAFSAVILQIARAMDVPRSSLHIFYDPSSESIAFNASRAIFFNYRYFEGMHLPDVQQGRLDSAIIYCKYHR